MKDPAVRKAENRIYEARARISWGDTREDVIADLVADGVSETQATEIVEAAWTERDREMRRLGRRDLLLGAILCAIGIGGGAGVLAFAKTYYSGGGRGQKVFGVMLAACAGLVIFGLYKCLRGYDRFTQGAALKGAVSEIDE